MKRARETSKYRLRGVAALQSIILWSAGMLLAVALTGCTSFPTDSVVNDTVNIEREHSNKARIRSVFVGDRNGSLLVRGDLEKRIFGRGPIPGHLHITVLGYDGSILGEETTRYNRRNNKSSKSRFSLRFSVSPKDVRTVRVRHHVGEDVALQMDTAPIQVFGFFATEY